MPLSRLDNSWTPDPARASPLTVTLRNLPDALLSGFTLPYPRHGESAGLAGPVLPTQSYAYDAEGNFPKDLRHQMRGVQACIWGEPLISRDYLNDLVFPRPAAVAEAAWTPAEPRDWLRLAVQAGTRPVR